MLRVPELERLDELAGKFEEVLKAEGDYRLSDRLSLESMLRSLILRDRWERIMDEGVAGAVDNYRKFDRDFRSWMEALGVKRIHRMRKAAKGKSPELERWLEKLERVIREGA